jgi:hypothetical protein
MTIPTLIFAFLIASLLGALYHLVCGGGPGKLFLYLLLSWIGFALGHFVAIWQGWQLLPMGQLDLGVSICGGLILLMGGDWISRIRVGPTTFPDDENGV